MNQNLTLDAIFESFAQNPRDVITRQGGVWFYAYVYENSIYVEAGRSHINYSKITMRRRLDCEKFEMIYDMYQNGTPRSKIRDITLNSSYWFGIFSDMLNSN